MRVVLSKRKREQQQLAICHGRFALCTMLHVERATSVRLLLILCIMMITLSWHRGPSTPKTCYSKTLIKKIIFRD